MTLRVLAMSAITSAVACALAARLTPPPVDATETPAIAWRPSLSALAIVSGLYVVTYFAAGTLVFPFVESFYATRALPSTVAIVTMQLFVRGPLFGLILAWVASSTRGTRIARACWAGATLSLLGGVAPLLLPNPFFTDAARWAHFVETSSSNLIFGAVAGWIFARSTATPGLKPRGYEQELRPRPDADALHGNSRRQLTPGDVDRLVDERAHLVLEIETAARQQL
jgi:hypothetical protein